MKGKYTIEIGDSRVKYSISIKRKLTIVQGNSATGKTTFCDYIRTALAEDDEYKNKSFYCNCADKLALLDNAKSWKSDLESISNSIIVIDEGQKFVHSEDFAKVYSKSNNYFIIISRIPIKELGYSIESIFEFRSVYKDNYFSTSLYNRYENEFSKVVPDIIITEDSNSGKQMYDILAEEIGNGCSVVSSGGYSGIYKVIKDLDKEGVTLYVIVDGEAFGSGIANVVCYIREDRKGDIHLFCPECFEYLLLCTRYYKKFLSGELTNTEDYCDVSEYSSWERYYANLLNTLCKDKYNFSYNKKKLSVKFKGESFIREFKKQLPDLFG